MVQISMYHTVYCHCILYCLIVIAAAPLSSPEYKTMVRCTPQLVDALKNDPQSINDSLFAADLISPGIRDLVLDTVHTRREKASRLVASMTDRANSTPSDFDKFVSILKEQGRWTNHIVSHLIATYTENKF